VQGKTEKGLPHFGQQQFTIMQDVAYKSAQGRLISVLEGGYDLEGLGQAAAAHVKGLVRYERK